MRWKEANRWQCRESRELTGGKADKEGRTDQPDLAAQKPHGPLRAQAMSATGLRRVRQNPAPKDAQDNRRTNVGQAATRRTIVGHAATRRTSVGQAATRRTGHGAKGIALTKKIAWADWTTFAGANPIGWRTKLREDAASKGQRANMWKCRA